MTRTMKNINNKANKEKVKNLTNSKLATPNSKLQLIFDSGATGGNLFVCPKDCNCFIKHETTDVSITESLGRITNAKGARSFALIWSECAQKVLKIPVVCVEGYSENSKLLLGRETLLRLGALKQGAAIKKIMRFEYRNQWYSEKSFVHTECSCHSVQPLEEDKLNVEIVSERVAYGENYDAVNQDQKLLLEHLFNNSTALDGSEPTCKREVKLTVDPAIRPFHHPAASRNSEERFLIQAAVSERIKGNAYQRARSEYVSRGMFITKASGKLRDVVDYRHLNNFLTFQYGGTPPSDELINQIGTSRVLTVIDIKRGFSNLLLSAESNLPGVSSRSLCAAEFSKGDVVEPLRMPQGLSVAPAEFCRAMEDIVSGTYSDGYFETQQWKPIHTTDLRQWIAVYMDDLLIYTKDFNRHLEVLDELLRRLSLSGFKIEREKIEIARQRVQFLGFIVGDNKVILSPKNLEKIANIRSPRSVKEARSVVSLLSYFRSQIPNFAVICEPIYKLLKPKVGVVYDWNDECETALQAITNTLVQNSGRSFIDYAAVRDRRKTLVLATDASRVGVGGVLYEEDTGMLENRKLIIAVSRRLTDTERRYSVTDIELLGVIYCVQRLRYHLNCIPFVIETDHKPLIFILGTQTVTGDRNMRWLLNLGGLQYSMRYVKGENNCADYLSRLNDEPGYQNMVMEEYAAEIRSALDASPDLHDVADEKLEHVAEAVKMIHDRDALIKEQKEDAELMQWEKFKFSNGTMDKANPYYKMRFKLVKKDNTIYVNDAIVVSEIQSQKRLMQLLHTSTTPHISIRKMLTWLRPRFWWPLMLQKANEWIGECVDCIRNNTRFEETFPSFTIPAGRFQRIMLDTILLPPTARHPTPEGVNVLIAIEVSTRWPWIIPLGRKTSENVALALISEIFPVFGVPTEIRSDAGKEFSNKTLHYIMDWTKSKHLTGVPYRPQSQGMVERLNKSVKELLLGIAYTWSQDWDHPSVLGAVHLALRTRPHRALGMKSPLECITGQTCRGLEVFTEINSYVPKHAHCAKITNDTIKRIVKFCQQADTDNRGSEILKWIDGQRFLRGIFQVGEVVFVRRDRDLQDKKKSHSCKEMAEVLAKVRSNTYICKTERGKTSTYHVNDMVHCNAKRDLKPLKKPRTERPFPTPFRERNTAAALERWSKVKSWTEGASTATQVSNETSLTTRDNTERVDSPASH